MDSFKTMLYNCLEKTTPVTKPSTSKGGGGGGGRVNISVSTPSSFEINDKAKTEESDINKENSLFSDINDKYWAYNDISGLYNAGIIVGYSDGTFRPENSVTRAEFLKMLITSLKIETDLFEEVPFEDVMKDEWYYDYVRGGYNAGLINGTSNNTFAPNSVITREDIATITYRACMYKKCKVASPGILNYSDSSNISDYARAAVSVLQTEKILLGYETGEFAPQKIATRAETAVIINRLLNCVSKEEDNK